MRRTLALVIVAAAILAGGAACGAGTDSPRTTTGSATTGAPGAGVDPACGQVTTTIADTTTKVQQELTKAASGTDADLEKSRQNVKQLYTDAAAAVRSAVGKATNPELKSAVETLAAEATTTAASLDSQQRASTALALMDRTKITAAVQKIQLICGQT